MQTIDTITSFASAGAEEARLTESAKRNRKKIFFVGDNRNTVNWGRGASIALEELLLTQFEIIGRVTCDFFNLDEAEAGYVGTLMPPRYYRHFRYLLSREWRRPVGLYLQLERLFGAKDFITENPAASVDNLMAYKQKYPVLQRIYDQANAADAIVLDGDGDIVLSTPPRRVALFLLAMIELGLRLGKPVFVVNSMISDCPMTGRNEATLNTARQLFSRCRAISMRDPESLEYLRKEVPEAKSTLMPDSLFAWFPRYNVEGSAPPSDGDFLLPYPESRESWGKLDFSKPYICIGGGAMACHEPARAVECYGHLVDELKKLGYAVYLTENDSPDSFLRQVAREKGIGLVPANAPILMGGAVLAHARLFISGRYHPTIFATLGGTPCIFLASHAHKMASLAQFLEYEAPRQFGAFPDDREVRQIGELAQSYLERGESLRAKLRGVAHRYCEEVTALPSFLQQHLNG